MDFFYKENVNKYGSYYNLKSFMSVLIFYCLVIFWFNFLFIRGVLLVKFDLNCF